MNISEIYAHILVVDDDSRLCDLVRRFLLSQNFIVNTARDPLNAAEILKIVKADLIILDVMMPHQDGFTFLASIRAGKTSAPIDIPVLMLTARDDVPDRITGFDKGADDYIIKPFDPQEFLRRIKAVLRRSMTTVGEDKNLIRLGKWLYNQGRGILQDANQSVHLTDTEAQMLQVLAENVGQPVHRAILAQRCNLPNDGDPASERAIDVRIARLRRRLGDDPRRSRYIVTVRGVGYRLVVD